MPPLHARAIATLILLLPWLALLTSLGTTWLVWDHERQSERKELRSQFDFTLRETVSLVEQRIAAYEQMLRGVQSLLATTSLKNRKAVHDYVDSLQLDANFSGVKVIGVAERVPARDKAAHVAAMRQLGFGDYRIEPDNEREMYAPIIQREPEIGRVPHPTRLRPMVRPDPPSGHGKGAKLGFCGNLRQGQTSHRTMAPKPRQALSCTSRSSPMTGHTTPLPSAGPI